MLRSLLYSTLTLITFCPLAQADEPCYRTVAEAITPIEDGFEDIENEQRQGIVPIEAKGQKTITCKGHEYVIPPAYVKQRSAPQDKPDGCILTFYNIHTSTCTADKISPTGILVVSYFKSLGSTQGTYRFW